MEKLSLIIILFFTLFLLSNTEIESCPSGWNSAALSNLLITLDNGNTCLVSIEYCYRDNNGDLEIIIKGYRIMDPYCAENANLNSNSFWNKLYKVLLQELTDPNIHGQQEYPPCFMGPRRIVRVQKANCWKYEIVPDLTNPNQSNLQAIPCIDDIECTVTYEACLNYNFNPPLLDLKKISENSDIIFVCNYNDIILEPGWDNQWSRSCTTTCDVTTE